MDHKVGRTDADEPDHTTRLFQAAARPSLVDLSIENASRLSINLGSDDDMLRRQLLDDGETQTA